MKKIIFSCLLILLAFVISACRTNRNVGTQTEAVIVENAWARPGSQGDNSAVYFDITAPQGDRIVSVSSEVAEAVELHLSKMVDGVMKMEHQTEGIALPPGEVVNFMPGGYHVMLIGLVKDLSPDETFELSLAFENSPEISLEVPVKQP